MKRSMFGFFLALAASAALADDAGRVERPVSKALGALDRDLVFKPIPACRIVDTRVVGGPIAAGSSRSFLAIAANAGVNFSSQGGSNTSCGTEDAGASAVMLTVTAVTPPMAGAATVFKYDTTAPASPSMQFHAGEVAAATLMTPIPNPLTIRDFTILSQVGADYTVDVVGLFTVSGATQFDCVNTSVSTFTIGANSTNFFNNTACPAGYRATTPYCWTAATGVFSQGSGYNANAAGNATFCAWQNTTGANQTVFGGNVCCRVPGR